MHCRPPTAAVIGRQQGCGVALSYVIVALGAKWMLILPFSQLINPVHAAVVVVTSSDSIF